jgi:hypothetical protein
MQTPILALILSAAVGATGSALAAGQVDVSFKPLDKLSDVGRGSLDGERNLEQLSAHFKALAPRLADGQTLTIEVLDVDLAGELKPQRRGGEVRVLRGGADWPSLTLQWTLNADGRTLQQGRQRVSDLNYLAHPPRGRHDVPLAYELRLIDRWFDEQVAPKALASAR